MELQLHGGGAVMRAVVQAVVETGRQQGWQVRPALAGEFLRRWVWVVSGILTAPDGDDGDDVLVSDANWR